MNYLTSYIQGSTNRRALGLVNFVPALTYHFCLNLPAAFTQPGARLLVEPCRYLMRSQSRAQSTSTVLVVRRHQWNWIKKNWAVVYNSCIFYWYWNTRKLDANEIQTWDRASLCACWWSRLTKLQYATSMAPVRRTARLGHLALSFWMEGKLKMICAKK